MNLAMLIAISGSAAGAPPGFDRDVRPILANHCWQCHGPDAGQRKGKLRLDIRADAIRTAIVPGKPDQSPLMERINAEDAEEVMPPPHAKKPITASQKETLKAWIAAGAPYESHWAFSPIAKPTPPKVKDEKKVRNEIDRFVLAKLEAQKLSLSDEATPRTQLRRAWLDLVGLPPTAEEQARFDADPPETRYERAVERLLASPHYGEKWGRHWLDQARYADSNGYTVDGDRTMWPYRDWVIKAHNDDMPFSQFTVEQLAGDLLPNATKLQRLATGFHRNTMINEEGGVDAEQFRCESSVDRVNTTGAVWLGLTVGCAQCHSHKYDPISHKEYFELYAFFNQQADVNNRGPTIEVAPGEVLGPAPAAKKTNEADWAKVRSEWEKRVAADKSPEPKWQAAKLDSYAAQSNRVLKKLDDGSILAMSEGSPNDAYFVQFRAPTKKVGAIRIRVLPDKSLPAGGPGTAKNGNFVLTEAELSLDGKNIPFTLALADHAKDKHGPELAIDADRTTGWALEMAKGGKGQHDLWLSLPQAIEVGDKPLSLSLRHDVNDRYLVGRFRIDTAESPALAHPDAMLWKSVKSAAPKAAGKRSEAEKKALQRAFVEYHPRAAGAVVNTTTV
ncbi:MAG TPA: DUF1549 domain-containing protein, partial [Planctomycetia bacterium]|nr:DUF1549 domain-containing protein [Planctomycetia bacterium]